jgi:DNA-binding transcriptional regulator LsrR (DeoR family)
MAPDGGNVAIDGEAALAARAAWLYYAGSLTQAQIAERLGVAPAKAHRLIARAGRDGLVRVFIEGPAAGCIALESQLTARFSLKSASVVPDLGEPDLPLRALGRAAAFYLHGVLEQGTHRIIGVGHGRTLAAAMDDLPRAAHGDTCFVSLLGGLPRRTGANPFDVIHRLAEKTSADAYLLPVPFFADTAADRPILLRQRGVSEALAIAATASLFLVGIGEVTEEAFLPSTGMIAEDEMIALHKKGAVGEVLGRFLDRNGRMIATDLHDRVIALAPEAMEGREVVGVAGGPGKTEAILSVLRSGLLSTLITDELTARRLLDAKTTARAR